MKEDKKMLSRVFLRANGIRAEAVHWIGKQNIKKGVKRART